MDLIEMGAFHTSQGRADAKENAKVHAEEGDEVCATRKLSFIGV